MGPDKPHSLALRFGPYAPPRTRRDAKLFCEIRGTVVVGSYSDAPIPWPRVKRGGGACLIVCGDLVRALKKEAEVAVAHHWGVSTTTVWKWRNALKVPRWNAGSTALARAHEAVRNDDRLERARANSKKPAAIAKLVTTMKSKPLSPALREAAAKAAKRPRSAEWKAKRSALWKEREHRPPPPERPWTPQEDAQLGTDEDAVVGKRIGRSKMAAWLRRKALGTAGRLVAVDGNAVHRLREANGWDRRAFAERSGVVIQAVWMIETGKRRRVDRDLLNQLARTLGIEREAIERFEC